MTVSGSQINEVLRYINKKYGTKPEYLWAKTPNNAVFRHNNNSKWYAALLTVNKQTLGIKEKGSAFILNLKCDPMLTGFVIDKISIFPAYHMNKTHWISVLLDGSVKNKKLYSLIDESYMLTAI